MSMVQNMVTEIFLSEFPELYYHDKLNLIQIGLQIKNFESNDET